MKRKNFIELLTFCGTAVWASPVFSAISEKQEVIREKGTNLEKLRADIIVIGGGLGGVACTLAALGNGRSVILTEETDWIGGQLTAQGVPPDEHQWIEQF